MNETTRTTCPYCGVGCGVLARRVNGEVQIAGDPQHPANQGRLCSKGSALADTLGPEDRLLHPAVHGRQVGWDTALNLVAERFASTIREHGPESVAFYVSGQLLTEDYYVANKLMKGFIGAANIDTNSRLCMASAVAGHKRAFGADVVPVCYEDLEHADLIVLVGSNTAWCHPVLFQRIVQAKEQRPHLQVVVIDPRRTPTCEIADLHLPILPGSDVALFNGLLAYLHRKDLMSSAFVAASTVNVEAALQTAHQTAGSIDAVAQACRLDTARVEAFYELFAKTRRVITAFSQGVNQSSAGTDKVSSIINCHLLTGRIGEAGMGPFSVTGQPNAMGGREVGGMANMLAAHMEIENAAHRQIVQDFWESPRIASRTGLKAVEMFDAIHDGRIKAVWIMATNPIVSLPDANRAREALKRCPFVVVSDCVARTDTSALAHVLLPAAAWGEKDGTVTNSERRISRQRSFLPAPGEAQPDWWIICEVAKRMEFGEAFAYDSPHEIFDEHARLSAAQNDGSRAFNIAGLTGLSRNEYDALFPIQWPVPNDQRVHDTAGASAGPARALPVSAARENMTSDTQGSASLRDHELARNASQSDGSAVWQRQLSAPGALRSHSMPGDAPTRQGACEVVRGTKRLFCDGRFYYPDGKARFVATVPRTPVHATDEQFPFVLNTGRVRDQWHTMTRTGRAARLSAHLPEPFVDMHPQDALIAGLQGSDLVRVSTRWGSLVARLRTSGEIPRGEVFVPIHWTSEFASDARVGALVNPVVDPVSGEPEFKHTPAAVEPFHVAWHGFVLTRQRLDLPEVTWWSLARSEHCFRYEIAGRTALANWPIQTRKLLGATNAAADFLDYHDPAAQTYRAAYVVNDRLEACAFFSARPNLPSKTWLATLFATESLGIRDRSALLAGALPDAKTDAGPIVCSCFGVGRNTIRDCITNQSLTTPRQVGERLRAGTNCGSCIPELRVLLAESARRIA